MWKVSLYCDVCRSASVESQVIGSNDAIFLAKKTARSLGWTYTQGGGWKCVRCVSAHKPLPLGDYARYNGTIITALGVALNGMKARILKVEDGTGCVHALFLDKSAGRYAHEAHWFFKHEFLPIEDVVAHAAE